MQIRGYEVGNLIGEAEKFRIYLASRAEQTAILKIAKTFEDGDLLADEASWFNQTRASIDYISDLEKKQNRTSARFDLLHARLMMSFLEPSQDDRRINIYEFVETGPDALTPLAKLQSETEIDVRTSVWILGRIFKVYMLRELIADEGDNPVIAYPLFSPDDYLIGPEHHRVIYFNHSGSKNALGAESFVKAVVEWMLSWLALSTEKTSEEQEYWSLLDDFAKLGRPDFDTAHREMYELVRKLWGIKYYPFTWRKKNTKIWTTIQEV